MAKKPPVTQSKREQAIARGGKTLRGNRLAYNASQQAKYKTVLTKLVVQMAIEVKTEISKLFKSQTALEFINQQAEAAAMDDKKIDEAAATAAGVSKTKSFATAAKQLTNRLRDKFDGLFASLANPIAQKMVIGASRASESSLHSSLQQLSGGISLKTGVVPEGMEDISKSLVNDNVSLIKSIPSQYLDDVSGAVFRSITTGTGVQELIPHLNKYEGVTLRRAKNIALDQTRKAYNFINKARMQRIGIKQFEWVHSGGGQHPRASHIAMSGNIYSFDNLPQINKDNPKEPPVYGIPGQAINCRCTMTPVIKFDDEE
jgi:SPP1 gp7 family putative phage head morphogenesis protein